jgi:hypothetical protein
MGFLRRRRRDPQDVVSQPTEARPAAAAEGPDAWRPAHIPDRKSSRANVAPPLHEAGTWLPSGVEPADRRRSRPSMPAIQVPPELQDAPPAKAAPLAEPAPAKPVAAPAPPPPPPPRPEPRSDDRDELRARLASLETQIAAGGAPSPDQQETIRALQARLANMEDELRKSSTAHMRPAPPAATALRVSILVLVFLVIAGSPLFMSRRSTCTVKGRPHVEWSIVKPFDDSGPARCKNELGGTVLLNSIGF